MSLIKWKNNDFFPAFEGLFGDFFNDDFYKKGLQLGTTVPAVNVKETDNAYLLDVAVPGVKKEDIKVNLDNGILTISSESEQESESKEDEKVTRKEYSYNSFSRSFSLPDNANEGEIDAEYKDGVLKINILKTTPNHVEKTRLIEVK